MATGRATKASKGSAGGKAARAAQTKSSSASSAAKSAKEPKGKPKAEASKPARPAAAPAVPPPAPAAAAAPKKKNVKRGAPPMLPRRMARRPDQPVPQGPPPPPRLLTPPGSLHAPARAPEGAEGLKQRLSAVMGLISQLRGLKRTINRQFFEAGLILQKLSEPTLYQAKGYGSFDKFIEREIERELSIGRSLAQDLLQIVKLFQREPAEEIGLDRLRNALRSLFPEPGPQAASGPNTNFNG